MKKFTAAFTLSLLAFGASAAPITYVVEGTISLWSLNPPGTQDILQLDGASLTYSISTDTSLDPFHVLSRGPIPPQTPGPSTSAQFGLLDGQASGGRFEVTNRPDGANDIDSTVGHGDYPSYTDYQFMFMTSNTSPLNTDTASTFQLLMETIDDLPELGATRFVAAGFPKDEDAALPNGTLLARPYMALPSPAELAEATYISPTFWSVEGPQGEMITYVADSLSISAIVPIPAAAWLFGSALGFLGWMRHAWVSS